MLPFGLNIWNIVLIIVIALIILVCIIGAIFLIVWAFRRPGSTAAGTPASGPSGGKPTAMQIAQERYARGEINRDEYLQIVSDLQKQA